MEWIKTSDRLPLLGQPVLALSMNSGQECGPSFAILSTHEVIENGITIIGWGSAYDYWTTVAPDYWMELPEPPNLR